MNESPWPWIAAGLLVLLIDLWMIANILRTDRSTSTKLSWILIVVLLPVIGMIAWGIAGPRSYKAISSREHSK